MSSFSAAWLAFREPADAAARSAALRERLAAWARDRERLRIVDLGAGTGANLRYLAPHLGGPQDWLLVDRDSALLRRADPGRHAGDLRVETDCLDLAAPGAGPDLAGVDLLTAAALMDLVSAAWFEDLAARAAAAAAAVLFALTYDGDITCQPADPDDEAIRAAVNRHQRRDKGFGPALGPAAPAHMAAVLRDLGYRVATAPSPWRLGPEQADLQRELLEGWATAAVEAEPALAAPAERWRARRLAWFEGGRSTLRVGHQDLFAWPR